MKRNEQTTTLQEDIRRIKAGGSIQSAQASASASASTSSASNLNVYGGLDDKNWNAWWETANTRPTMLDLYTRSYQYQKLGNTEAAAYTLSLKDSLVQTSGGKYTEPTYKDFLKQAAQQNIAGDKEHANDTLNMYRALAGNPASSLWNPYTGITNQKAVEGLAACGIDISGGVDAATLNAMEQYAEYTHLGVGGTPLAPTKTSTIGENIAYWKYQLQKDEATTQNAEKEWLELQNQINLLVAYGYSDDDILNRKIDWSQYGTLSSMDEGKASGIAVQLNRGVGYTKDALYGALYAARNGGGTGNMEANIAYYALGYGNMYVPDPMKEAALDRTSEWYHPYAQGTTLMDEALTYGTTAFDRKWLDAHKDMANGTDSELATYKKILTAVENSENAEEERKNLYAWAEEQLNKNVSPEGILKKLNGSATGATGYTSGGGKTLFEKEYPTLAKMEYQRTNMGALALGYAVDFAMPYFEADMERAWTMYEAQQKAIQDAEDAKAAEERKRAGATNGLSGSETPAYLAGEGRPAKTEEEQAYIDGWTMDGFNTKIYGLGFDAQVTARNDLEYEICRYLQGDALETLSEDAQGFVANYGRLMEGSIYLDRNDVRSDKFSGFSKFDTDTMIGQSAYEALKKMDDAVTAGYITTDARARHLMSVAQALDDAKARGLTMDEYIEGNVFAKSSIVDIDDYIAGGKADYEFRREEDERKTVSLRNQALQKEDAGLTLTTEEMALLDVIRSYDAGDEFDSKSKAYKEAYVEATISAENALKDAGMYFAGDFSDQTNAIAFAVAGKLTQETKDDYKFAKYLGMSLEEYQKKYPPEEDDLDERAAQGVREYVDAMSAFMQDYQGEHKDDDLRALTDEMQEKDAQRYKPGKTKAAEEAGLMYTDENGNPIERLNDKGYWYGTYKGIEKGAISHAMGWAETYDYWVLRKSDETLEGYLRATYSREEYRAYLDATVPKIQDADEKARLTEKLAGYEGDIYDFGYDPDRTEIKAWIEGRKQKIGQIDKDLYVHLDDNEIAYANFMASATDTAISSLESTFLTMLTGGGALATLGATTAVYGLRSGAEVGAELADAGMDLDTSKAWALLVTGVTGALESCTQRVLTGIGAATGVSRALDAGADAFEAAAGRMAQNAPGFVKTFATVSAKTAAKGVLTFVGEGLEEGAEEVFESGINNAILNLYDGGNRALVNWEDVLTATWQGGLIGDLIGSVYALPEAAYKKSKIAQFVNAYGGQDALTRQQAAMLENAANADIKTLYNAETDAFQGAEMDAAYTKATFENLMKGDFTQMDAATAKMEAARADAEKAARAAADAEEAAGAAEKLMAEASAPFAEEGHSPTPEESENVMAAAKFQIKSETNLKNARATADDANAAYEQAKTEKEQLGEKMVAEARASAREEVLAREQEKRKLAAETKAKETQERLTKQLDEDMALMREKFGLSAMQEEKIRGRISDVADKFLDNSVTARDWLTRRTEKLLPGWKLEYKEGIEGAGYTDPKSKTIVLNSDATSASGYRYTVAHELTHALKREGKKFYEAYADAVVDAVYGGKSKYDYDNDLEAMRGRYAGRGLTDAQVKEELVADLTERVIYGADLNAVNRLISGDNSVLKRVCDWVKESVRGYRLSTNDPESARLYRGMMKAQGILERGIRDAKNRLAKETGAETKAGARMEIAREKPERATAEETVIDTRAEAKEAARPEPTVIDMETDAPTEEAVGEPIRVTAKREGEGTGARAEMEIEKTAPESVTADDGTRARREPEIAAKKAGDLKEEAREAPDMEIARKKPESVTADDGAREAPKMEIARAEIAPASADDGTRAKRERTEPVASAKKAGDIRGLYKEIDRINAGKEPFRMESEKTRQIAITADTGESALAVDDAGGIRLGGENLTAQEMLAGISKDEVREANAAGGTVIAVSETAALADDGEAARLMRASRDIGLALTFTNLTGATAAAIDVMRKDANAFNVRGVWKEGEPKEIAYDWVETRVSAKSAEEAAVALADRNVDGVELPGVPAENMPVYVTEDGGETWETAKNAIGDAARALNALVRARGLEAAYMAKTAFLRAAGDAWDTYTRDLNAKKYWEAMAAETRMEIDRPEIVSVTADDGTEIPREAEASAQNGLDMGAESAYNKNGEVNAYDRAGMGGEDAQGTTGDGFKAGGSGEAERGTAGAVSFGSTGKADLGRHAGGSFQKSGRVLELTEEAAARYADAGFTAVAFTDTTDAPEEFAAALSDARESQKYGWEVDARDADDLKENGIQTILAPDGNSGAGIFPNGNITAVFKKSGTGDKRTSAKVMFAAIEMGGDRLDCYAGDLFNTEIPDKERISVLPTLYAKFGFVPVAVVKGNPEFYGAENGQHDIIFWMLGNRDTGKLLKDFTNDTYTKYTIDEFMALPVMEYEEAEAYRDKLIDAEKAAKPENIAPKMEIGKDKIVPATADDDIMYKLSDSEVISLEGLADTARAAGDPEMFAQAVRGVLKKIFDRTKGKKLLSWEVNNPVNVVAALCGNLKTHLFVSELPGAGTQADFDKKSMAMGAGRLDAGDLSITMYTAGKAVEKITNVTPPNSEPDSFAKWFYDYMTKSDGELDFAYQVTAEKAFHDAGIHREIELARAQIQNYLNSDAVYQVASWIRSENARSKDTKVGKLIEFSRSFRSGLLDMTVPATLVDDFVGGSELREAATYVPYAKRLAEKILNKALIDMDGNRIGLSFRDTVEGSGFQAKKENVEALSEYMLAMHALDRSAASVPVNSSVPDSTWREVINGADEQTKKTAQAIWNWWYDGFMRGVVAKDGGTGVTQLDVDDMQAKYPHYAPTLRVMENGGEGGVDGKAWMLMTPTGSDLPVANIFDSYGDAIKVLTGRAAQNKLGRTFHEIYQRNDDMGFLAREVTAPEPEKASAPGADAEGKAVTGAFDAAIGEAIEEPAKGARGKLTSSGNNLLKVFLPDGQAVYYEVADKPLFELLNGRSAAKVKTGLEALGRVTRAMAVLTTGNNPLFAFRNAARDFQQSVNHGSWASNYMSGIAKWLPTFFEVAANSMGLTATDAYKQYENMGGGEWERMSREGRAGGGSRTQEAMFKGYWKRNPLSATKRVAGAFLEFASFSHLNQWVETTSRYAEFKYGKNADGQKGEARLGTYEGRREAFMHSMEATVDFQRRGSSAGAAVLRQVVPYFNATMQGAYQQARSFTKAERGRFLPRAAKTMLSNMVMGALTSGIICMFGDADDKDEYADLAQEIRAANVILPIRIFGGDPVRRFIRIPLAQNVFARVGHALGQAIVGGQMTDIDGFSLDLAAATKSALSDAVPDSTIFSPIIDVLMNENYWGGLLVSDRQMKQHVTNRYNENTGEAFKKLSLVLNRLGVGGDWIAPTNLEYLFQQYTGIIGQVATGNVLDRLEKAFTIDPAYSNDIYGAYYDNIEFANEIIESGKTGRAANMLKPSLTDEEITLAYEAISGAKGADGIIADANSKITKLYDRIEEINGNDALTDHDKQILSRDARDEMLVIQKGVNDWFGDFKKQYVAGDPLSLMTFAPTGEITPLTEVEKLPDVFAADRDAGAAYLAEAERLQGLFPTRQIVPEPNAKFTNGKDADGYDIDVKVPDEMLDGFHQAYYDAYIGEVESLTDYLDEYGEGLTDKQKSDEWAKARSRAQATAKEWYLQTLE